MHHVEFFFYHPQAVYYSRNSLHRSTGIGRFEPVWIKNIEMQNRFVLAAAAGGVGSDASGTISKEGIDRLTMHAGNRVGLIITGATGISDSALSNPGSASLGSDRHIPGFMELTESVHWNGGKLLHNKKSLPDKGHPRNCEEYTGGENALCVPELAACVINECGGT